jgi:hypothetical protein
VLRTVQILTVQLDFYGTIKENQSKRLCYWHVGWYCVRSEFIFYAPSRTLVTLLYIYGAHNIITEMTVNDDDQS